MRRFFKVAALVASFPVFLVFAILVSFSVGIKRLAGEVVGFIFLISEFINGE